MVRTKSHSFLTDKVKSITDYFPKLPQPAQQPAPIPQPQEAAPLQPQASTPQPVAQPSQLVAEGQGQNGQQPTAQPQLAGQDGQSQIQQPVEQPQPLDQPQELQQLSRQKQRRQRRYVEKIICPRCGKWGRVSIEKRSNREYVYVRHYDKSICYLGPANGYFAVQQVHGPLALTSLNAVDYAEVMAHAAEKFLERIRNDNDDEARIAEKVINSLMSLADVIRDACYALGPRRPACIEKVLKTILI